VFRDASPGGGGDQRGGGRDVERIALIAAGAARVYKRCALLRGKRETEQAAAQRVDKAGQFVDRLAASGQPAEQGCDAGLRLRQRRRCERLLEHVQDRVEQRAGLLAREGFVALEDLFERGAQDVGGVGHDEVERSMGPATARSGKLRMHVYRTRRPISAHQSARLIAQS
jgi:hypothetical protein